jgi:hypothetical protein
MSTLCKAICPWALERAPRHTCAKGGVDLPSYPQRTFANPEIRMR